MTTNERKSCINTIILLRDLAFNIHGVMDVIDAENCKKMIEFFESGLDEENMKHYRQGREDEKAIKEGRLIQSFNPD